MRQQNLEWLPQRIWLKLNGINPQDFKEEIQYQKNIIRIQNYVQKHQNKKKKTLKFYSNIAKKIHKRS